MSLRLLDFFCGAGGFGLGFKQEGYEIVGAWDFDKFAVQSYKANVDEEVKLADVTQMTYKDLPVGDVWSFGFACQDLSVAGQQEGFIVECIKCGHQYRVTIDSKCPKCDNDKVKAVSRSGTFFEIMRLLDETAVFAPDSMPSVIVAENVKALKKYLPLLKQEYEKRGYSMYFTLYNSKYWGVPQSRERYFVVGVRQDYQKLFSFLTETPKVTTRLVDFLDKTIHEKYYVPNEKAKTMIKAALDKVKARAKRELEGLKLEDALPFGEPERITQEMLQSAAVDKDGCAFTATACYYKGVTDHSIITSQRTCIIEDTLDGQGCSMRTRSYRGQEQQLEIRDDYISNTITTVPKDAMVITVEPQIEVVGMLDISSHDHSRRIHDPMGIAPTATAVSGGTHHIKIFDYDRFRVRRLTPIEYGRIQGFPMDTWKQVVSDTQAYKQFGNAVTVPVARAVAKAIKEYLEG